MWRGSELLDVLLEACVEEGRVQAIRTPEWRCKLPVHCCVWETGCWEGCGGGREGAYPEVVTNTCHA